MAAQLKTVEDFFFALPLYAEVDLPEDCTVQASVYQKNGELWNGENFFNPKITKIVDGYCPYCGRQATFNVQARTHIPNGDPWRDIRERDSFDQASLSCTRDPSHLIIVYFRISGMTVTKIGQYPSLADIANDEASQYREILDKADASELHKAIGLAAHGVGVGSFVYLRRVFENLIYSRFDEFRELEGWDEAEFLKRRMDEKVEFLKDHIPEFLYENRKLYAVLSKGIHELSEEDCLGVFDPIKFSIKAILEEDKKKKEELELRKMAQAAIDRMSK